MKKIIQAGLVISAFISTTSYADYQFEVGAFLGEFDAGGMVDADITGFSGQFNFQSVDTSKGPWSQATFLDKSSYISLGYIELDGDLVESDSTGLTGRFVTSSDFIFVAEYADSNLGDSLSIGAGRYINDNLDFVVRYSDEDETDSSTLSVDFHGLLSLGGESAFAYDIGVGYLDNDGESGTDLLGRVEYYPNQRLGFGAAIGLTSAGDTDTTAIAIYADYFITEAFRLTLAYENDESETNGSTDLDADSILLNGSIRF